MMSLEALSHAASTAFPIFEREQVIEIERQAERRKRENFPPVSPLRRHSSLGSSITKELLPQKDLCSMLPSVPTLSRQTSHPCYSVQATKTVDWARHVTLEERAYIREKIKAAYSRKASTFEDLLELTCAIEEEFVFAAAPSRLDYFKSGVQFEKRVSEKQSQIYQSPGSLYPPMADTSTDDDIQLPFKKVKMENKN